MWIGLYDEPVEGSFKWIDGNSYSLSSYSTSPWSSGQADNWQNIEDCARLEKSFNGLWNDGKCWGKLHAFVCNKPPTIYQDNLYVGINLHNEIRYTWAEANTHCKTNYDGATLATNIDNEWTYSKIQEIMGAIDSNEVFIGFNDNDNEGIYEWKDGSGILSTSSSYWYPGEPNNDSSGSGKDCGDLYIQDDNWHGFNEISCDKKLGAFICNHDYYVVRYGDYIGVLTEKYGNDRLTFNQAENYCQTHYGTHLASVHNQDNNDELIYVHIAISNIRGGNVWSFVGLNDPNNNNNFEWTDETNYNYTATFDNGWSSGQNCVAFASNSNVTNIRTSKCKF